VQVQKVTLSNFRNYSQAFAELSPGRNILIGENAQGKTNFLEAIEIISTGRSDRSNSDLDLIKSGADEMRVEVQCRVGGSTESISMGMRRNTAFDGMRPARQSNKQVEKFFKLNGLSQTNIKSIKRRLVTVSFKSQDLNLLRGGPKFRRDWIDTILAVLRPVHEDALNKYLKVVAQRNRLLKQLCERGRVSVTDNDQLKAWDTQLARFGAQIIKQRMGLISELLPEAEQYQEHISGQKEVLSAQYLFKGSEPKESSVSYGDDDADSHQSDSAGSESPAANSETSSEGERLSAGELNQASEDEVANLILSSLKDLRYDEIRRKQTLIGPHRDDIQFSLNDRSAVYFASQGQQRSLVLSLKLAELKRVTESLNEPPVLLLDDVLAELDLKRQCLLMSLVAQDMQTVITTTHISGFEPEWLQGARFLSVRAGAVAVSEEVPL
jgi:DNA replication and repair protein RecF